MKAKFTNKLLTPLEIDALSSDEKIEYIALLQGRLMSYQLVFDAVKRKDKLYH